MGLYKTITPFYLYIMDEFKKKYSGTAVELTSDNILHYIGGKDIGNSISANFDNVVGKNSVFNGFNQGYDGYGGYTYPNGTIIDFSQDIYPNNYKYPMKAVCANEPKKYKTDDSHISITRRKLNFKY